MISSHQGVGENRKMGRADKSLSLGGVVKTLKMGRADEEFSSRGW